jgi:hypothetical protein
LKAAYLASQQTGEPMTHPSMGLPRFAGGVSVTRLPRVPLCGTNGESQIYRATREELAPSLSACCRSK